MYESIRAKFHLPNSSLLVKTSKVWIGGSPDPGPPLPAIWAKGLLELNLLGLLMLDMFWRVCDFGDKGPLPGGDTRSEGGLWAEAFDPERTRPAANVGVGGGGKFWS